MVTKQKIKTILVFQSSVLAKILMVTKRLAGYIVQDVGSVLAKILMVTKPRTALLKSL